MGNGTLAETGFELGWTDLRHHNDNTKRQVYSAIFVLTELVDTFGEHISRDSQPESAFNWPFLRIIHQSESNNAD